MIEETYANSRRVYSTHLNRTQDRPRTWCNIPGVRHATDEVAASTCRGCLLMAGHSTRASTGLKDAANARLLELEQ